MSNREKSIVISSTVLTPPSRHAVAYTIRPIDSRSGSTASCTRVCRFSASGFEITRNTGHFCLWFSNFTCASPLKSPPKVVAGNRVNTRITIRENCSAGSRSLSDGLSPAWSSSTLDASSSVYCFSFGT